ncbi:MAG: Na/Pi cotransporter family protein [Clostridia bacterium]|nr:Na/Pi cotransporter family protein [Clostridia bacterium]
MGISNIISLLGGVALFLFGMTLMGDGLKRVAGNRLELVLYQLTNTPLKGILLGSGVTAVIQSSSATSVMVVGFVNSGMMPFKNAIGIVLGAILGTSITGWVICLSALEGAGGIVSLFSTATITGVVAVIGIILRMFCKSKTKNFVGDILMGFAVLMFGMSAMSSAVSPLRDSDAFLNIMTTFSNPIIGILVGTAFTCIIQSASAAVGILQALAVTGAITFDIALPMLMGISIGAALPVLLSALGAKLEGKRTAVVYLLIDLLGSIILGTLFYILNFAHPMPELMGTTLTMVTVAALNTVLRLAMVILFAPMIRVLEKAACALVRGSEEKIESDLDLLEERFIAHPAVAIDQCSQVMASMAEKSKETYAEAVKLLDGFKKERFEYVGDMEELIDSYEDKLGSYLVKLTGQTLTTLQNDSVSKFLHTLTDFERISDHAKNIAECAEEIDEKKIKFSEAAQRELAVLRDAVMEILELAVNSFTTNDLDIAKMIEPLEEVIDGLCDEMKLHHIDRIQTGECTYQHGFVFNDLITNYERIADHCSNVAVALIELKSDQFDTHKYLSSLKEAKDEAFDMYLNEYMNRYRI